MIVKNEEGVSGLLGSAVAIDLRWRPYWWGVSSTTAFLFGVLALLQQKQSQPTALLNWSWLALFLLFGFWFAAFWRNWTVYASEGAITEKDGQARWPYARPGAPWEWVTGRGQFPLWPAHAWSRGVLLLTAAILLLYTAPLAVWRLFGAGLLLTFIGWWWRTWRESMPRLVAALLLLVLPFWAPLIAVGQPAGRENIAFAAMLLGAGMALTTDRGRQADWWALAAVTGPAAWQARSGAWAVALLLLTLGVELAWLNHRLCRAGQRHLAWLLSLWAVILL